TLQETGRQSRPDNSAGSNSNENCSAEGDNTRTSPLCKSQFVLEGGVCSEAVGTVSVSNKVALYAMLPATGILLFGLASIFIYPTTIEAKVSIVSSIATSVTVLFLISERLRDSALRKLEFLNRRALRPSLRASRGRGQSIGEEQSRTFAQSTELLKGHGRFLRLKLYPKNLITTLDNV